jgi:hypothetical protein
MCDDFGTISNNVMWYVKVLFNTDLLVLLNGKSKVKKFHYRPGGSLRVPGG